MNPSITLLQGMESLEEIQALIDKTRLASEPVKQALINHYVNGYETALAYKTNGISQQQFQRGQQVLINALRESDVNANISEVA